MIETENLKLVPTELKHVELYMKDKQELVALLQVSVPDAFPEFPETMPWLLKEIKADPSVVGWLGYMVIHAADKVLIGDGGFKGKPDEEGRVEIGYSIIPEYRRRGFATEMARALVDYAFSQPGVKAVEAHTLADGTASIKVLKNVGMSFVAEVHDPEDGELFHWKVDKETYNNSSRSWPSASR